MLNVRYIFIYLLLLVLCLGTAKAQDASKMLTLENEVMYSKILGQEVRYSVCLPEGYFQTNASYPVAYMLHGLGDNASSWLEYGRLDVWTKQRVAEGKIIPMIYIMPEGYTNYYVNDWYGKFRYQDMFVKELVPHVDKKYRTLADKAHRATVGYSMGGFGALTLALQHQDVFSATVPLSISIRTDKQYTEEESEGWNEQWGRLFGGIGLEGEKRLTDYYKQNSPAYIFKNKPVNTKIFILNGDDEGSLAYSNEELHILMRSLHVPHEYRVRDGGHDFKFWFQALSDGLNFVSDAFEGKSYRGDEVAVANLASVASLSSDRYQQMPFDVHLPKGYEQGNRSYPVLYIDAQMDCESKDKIARLLAEKVETMQIAPMLAIFFDSRKMEGSIEAFIQHCQAEYRIRSGRRFSAYLGYQSAGEKALGYASREMFTYVASLDGRFEDGEAFLKELQKQPKKGFQRTAIYIDSPDKGMFYETNGKLHLLLKDMDVKHEYRVSQSIDQEEYLLRQIDAILESVSDKIHI